MQRLINQGTRKTALVKRHYPLSLIVIGAVLLRVIVLPFVTFPGVADPNHYYNLGVRLVNGEGYTINYIWQYNDLYADVVHEDDHWMPLSAGLAAVSMKIFGIGTHQAIIPFIIIGALLPLITYWAARQLDLARELSLIAAGFAAVLPEFLLNSVRTDTTVPNALLVCLVILLLNRGLRRGETWTFIAAGVCAGLAYLNRSENILLLPMLIALFVVWRWITPPLPDNSGTRHEGVEKALTNITPPRMPSFAWTGGAQADSSLRLPSNSGEGWEGGKVFRHSHASSLRTNALKTLLIPLIAVIVVSPWLARNYALNGTFSTPTTNNMFFLTDHRDHYLFDAHLSLQTYLASATPAEIIGRRLFEMAASVKLMITTLDVFLPVLVIGGALLMLRDRPRWRVLAPTIILLAGVFVFYTILVPYKSQGGSFKKAYLTLIPLLIPLGVYALERLVSDARLRAGAALIAIVLMGMNAFELVRADQNAARSYLAQVEAMRDAAFTLPDLDGRLIVMTQDPYILGYVGMNSLMFPQGDRDEIYAVAQRYGVDYLLMPSDRAALDALLFGDATDPRFTRVIEVPGTPFIFYRVEGQ